MIHCVLLLFFARAWRAWQCQRQCHCQGPTLLNLACQSTQVNGSLKMQIKVLLRSSCSILKQLLSSFHQMSHYISTISLQEVSSRSMYSILASKPLHGQLKLVPMKIPWLSRMFIQISIIAALDYRRRQIEGTPLVKNGRILGMHCTYCTWMTLARCSFKIWTP